MIRSMLLGLAFLLASLPGGAPAFDQTHAHWNTLLARHVTTFAQGNASAVNYTALKTERGELKAYLDSLSAVSEGEFSRWNKAQRLAFLINAYNAFTIELILTRYPDLDSIKDLGSVFSSPWKRKFFRLLGLERHLDDIEHGMIRAPGAYDDPRIHVALVCASIGCPMLRPEAYTAEKLDAQLEDGLKRFLADATRNRYEAAGGRLQVSRIFDWYGKDFEKGHKGFDTLKTLFSRHASQLAATSEGREKIRIGDYRLEFLDYDWKLNDSRRHGM